MKELGNKYNTNLTFKQSIIILTIIMLCSCATSHHDLQGYERNNTANLSRNIRGKIDQLQSDLKTLGINIDEAEAKKLADTSIRYSLFLADEYKLVWPPYLHNILVNIGIKDRGLCYHWAEDLMKQLTSLELKSFNLHEGVAHKGSDLREHNSVVVTAIGQEFNEGIVLDPWRDSGELYWARVKSDRYPWEER